MPREWLIQHRAGTLAEWEAAEASGPALLAGERAYVTDLKLDVVGDGVTKVAGLGAVGSGTYADMGSLGFEQARSPEFSVIGAGKAPLDTVGDYLYGYVGNVLYRTDDPAADTWVEVIDFATVTDGAAGAFVRLLPLADGEVLAVKTAAIFRSTGWAADPLTATFARTLQSTGVSWFTMFSVDSSVRSGWAVATSYIAGADMTESRYVWLSTNNGATWSTIFDFEATYAAQNGSICHMHIAALDDLWSATTPRIWASMHDTATPASFSRIIYSDNGGTSWVEFDSTLAPAPTVGVSTEAGMVFGTDAGPNGIYRVLRTVDPSDMVIELAFRSRRKTSSGWGWAAKGCRDKYGHVHMSWRTQGVGMHGAVLSSDGYRGDETMTIAPLSGADLVLGEQIVAFGDYLLGTYNHSDNSVPMKFLARLPVKGTPVPDDNGIGGGTADEESVAAGYQATAGKEAVSVGSGATSGLQCVAVGRNASAPMSGSVSVGRNASVTSDTGTAVGFGASVTVGVAVGAVASTLGGTAVGHSAAANSDLGSALGRESVANNGGNVAIGRQATTTHHKSVALGYQQTTTADNQVRIGDVHIEMVEIADPATPAANSARLFVRDNGSGKTQVCVRFPTGAVQVISTEP